MKIGDRWARMKCIGVDEVEKWLEFEGGGKENYYVKVYRLVCECGKEVEVTEKEFNGKRKVKDCGCGVGKDDGATVVMSITVPLSVRRLIGEVAREECNGNMSQAVCVGIRGYVEYVRDVESKKTEVSK